MKHIQFFLIFFSIFLFSCNGGNFAGHYQKKTVDGAAEHLLLKNNGSYSHYLMKDNKMVKQQSGEWQVEKEDNRQIRLENWKNQKQVFDTLDLRFQTSSNLLFLNGKDLDDSPDGNNEETFFRED